MVQTETATVESCLRASREAQQRGQFDRMLELAEQARELDDRDLRATLRLLECCLYCGEVGRVMKELARLEDGAGKDHGLLCRIGEFYTHCADHESAYRCYSRAVRLQAQNPEYLFALSAAEIAVGKIDEAEKHLTDAIRLNAHDYDAYRNRAMLKKQSVDDNHIAEIEALLGKGTRTPAGEVQLCYALAKEYEDLGRYERSFEFLRRGAGKRRDIMSYRVDGDLAVMEKLESAFSAELFASPAKGCPETGPIFVLGLPRSGTTLVDRIVSSHSAVDSLGEINNFAYSLMHEVGQAADKLGLIDLSVKLDFARLGQRYVDSIRGFGAGGPYLIDKTPLNYLYIGLIRLALPNAKILHVHRNPMDSCFGMYRTLFRAGFPFSYDFDDLGRYYLAYRRLMDHWRAVLPGGFLDISYERLVDNQESVSREIIAYCGLEWEAACLDFHKNNKAVLTASSAQVRQPMYKDALQRWRRYEKELQAIAGFLQANGISIDAD